MPRPSSFFETGTHHVLCKIAGLDPKEFPYPQDFQDCWDHHHVRLACSDRPAHAAVSNAWPDIVQGLTTTITNSKQLSEILSRWNEGDPRGWNIDALEAFLNQKADRDVPSMTLTSTSTSATSTPEGRFQDGGNNNERPIDEGDDMKMSDHGDDDGTRTPPGASVSRPFLRWDHNEETAEDQFLSREERDRFFKVILPGMQQLALRLPELVKRPIPFLKQQQDSAVTLSQEQIACLLANAFFCTFPCRNAPNQHFSNPNPNPYRKRPHSDKSEGRNTGKQEGGAGGGRTLDSAPKDPHGSTAPRLKKQSSSNTDPYRNTDGQLSLFAYFKKTEPKTSFRPESSRTSTPTTATSRHFDNDKKQGGHHQQGRSVRPGGSGHGGGGAGTVKQEDLSGHVKVESGRETHNAGHKSATRNSHTTTGQGYKRPPFPRYPSINFSSLFYSDEARNPCTSTNAAKLRCIIHYFDRILQQMPTGVVTFHRQVLNDTVTLNSGEMLNQAPFHYSNVQIELDAPLEDDAPLGALQLDFANKVIGGGVLGRGAVQEEIRFAICPELIISRLFTQTLQSNEALLIKGAERFSNYNGYAQTFEWHSNHIDTTPRDKLGRRKTEICAIDALPFKSVSERLDQFCESAVLRELNKAIVGFRRSPITSTEWGLCRGEAPSPRGEFIATGNWGCGAFGGHLQLKFLIQLMAASVCSAYSRLDDGDVLGRDLVYFTYGLDGFADEIRTFMAHLQASPQLFEPWKLLDCIINYPIKSGRGDIVALRSDKSLLDYVSASFGFPNASHSNGGLSVTDTQPSTFETSSWSDDAEYTTPEPEPLSD